MSKFDVFHMIKRSAKAAAVPSSTCGHTFRATGINAYLEKQRRNTATYRDNRQS